VTGHGAQIWADNPYGSVRLPAQEISLLMRNNRPMCVLMTVGRPWGGGDLPDTMPMTNKQRLAKNVVKGIRTQGLAL